MEKRKNDIVNKLNKSKREEYPDLKAQRAAFDAAIKAERKQVGVGWHALQCDCMDHTWDSSDSALRDADTIAVS